jgi:hypothetical protein
LIGLGWRSCNFSKSGCERAGVGVCFEMAHNFCWCCCNAPITLNNSRDRQREWRLKRAVSYGAVPRKFRAYAAVAWKDLKICAVQNRHPPLPARTRTFEKLRVRWLRGSHSAVFCKEPWIKERLKAVTIA